MKVNKVKRAIIAVFAVVFAFVAPIFAANVAKIGDVEYATIDAAYDAAQAGETIKLLSDVTLTGKLTISKAITIDGDGHSIIANHTAYILETSSDCEIKNVTLDTNNKAKGVKIASGNAIFDNITIPNSNKSDAITISSGASLTAKTYLKVVSSNYTLVDARSGIITVEPGTVFDMDSWRANASPATCDLTGAVDVNGKPYFCAYGSTTYYKTLSSGTTTITDLTLLDNVALNSDLSVKGTLNLNGKTLTIADGKTLKTGGNLEIVGGTFAGPILLTNASYTLIASEGIEVTTSVAGSRVVYKDGSYTVVKINYVAQIGETKYETIAEAIAAAQDGDIVVILPGEYGPINISNKNITIKGTVGDNGELLTTIKGGNPAITGHGFNGTIKDIKIVDAFKVMYAEPAGNVTVDNVYVTGATYGFHLVAYTQGLTWTIQNSYMDLAWANSLGVDGNGDAAIVIKGNTFASTNPYYPDYGALAVNTFLPNVTVEENIFGKNTRIMIRESIADTSNVNISKNYHADGVENAFVGDSVKVGIPQYYTEVAEDGTLSGLVTCVVRIGTMYYATFADAVSAAQAGDTITLLADVELPAPVTIGKSIAIDGNGKVITQSASCENTHALLYFDVSDVLDVTIGNVVFDGIKGGAAIRTLGANITVDNCVFRNGEHTQVQGLLRLTEGKAIVKDSKFLNNKCQMAISFNYDTNGLEGDTFLVDNCVFEGNIANTAALVYYVKGAKCEIKNSEFVGNRVNCNANGATVYLGFQEDCVVTGNLFKDNVVADASTSTRVAGAVFFGYQAEVSGNAFVNNTASNANGDTLGQICTSTYYDCAIDLSGNYWGGEAPVYGKDYTIQHQTGAATFDLNSYYSNFEIGANGNVVLSDAVALAYVAKVGKLSYPTVAAAIAAAKAGNTVTVIADIELAETVKVTADKELTLDLNGKTIDGTGKVRIAIASYGNLTIKDSVGNGVVKTGIGTAGNCVNICGGVFTLESGNIYSLNNGILIDEQAATVNITGGKITAETTTRNSAAFYISSTSDTVVNISGGELLGYNGILLWNNTVVNVTGGKITATGSTAIQGNGSKDNTAISISGNAELSGYYAAIYHPQGGELTIADNAKLTGWTGVVVKGGEVTISGGEITGTGAANAYRPVSSGYVDTGDALYVEHYDNSDNSENYGTPTVTITGGTFVSANGQAVASYANPNGDVEALEKFISGGTFATKPNADYCAEGFTPVKVEGGYSVGILPDAEVTNLGSITVGLGDYTADAYMMYDIINGGKLQEATVPYDLTLAMDFKAKDTAETAAQNAFGNYTTDFFITMSGMSGESFVGDGCYLAGYYPSFNAWVKIPLDGFTVENGKVYPVITSAGFDFKYTDICGTVGQFICGIYLTPAVLAANPNLSVDLTLGLAENKDAALNAQFLKVDNYVYDADDLQPVTLPEVVITDIKSTLTDADPDLTFALNFAIKDVGNLSEEYLKKLFAKYGDYYTDYVLTISGLTDPNGSVKFNANGNGDGYLAGQYDAWSKSWVTVPFSDVTVKNGQSFYVMEYAAELMNKGGLRLTLKEIAEIVKNFDCGVYFTPEFLAANPNLKVDLELKVFTEDESGNKVGDISVATNTFDKDDFSVEAAKLDIRIVNGEPQIGFAGEGKLVLNAATALTGEWTKNVEYTAVENDGDDTKTWVTPKDGYYFFKGYIVR